MSSVLPILFNGDMVRAILGNQKTATRRVIKQEKYLGVLQSPSRRCNPDIPDKYYIKRLVNPPCEAGDILYVRESWAFQCCLDCMENADKPEGDCLLGKTSTIHEDKDSTSEGCYIYRADHPTPEHIIWRPSIHMPKAAARIWLRVTDMYPQRLQEMTLDDFAKEGVSPEGAEECKCAWEFDGCRESSCTNKDAYLLNRYIVPFAALWNSTIHKDQLDLYRWATNPWVWVIEFERCEKPEMENV